MKNSNIIKKSLLAVIGTLALSSSLAQAVPWCHGGTIVEIQDVTWNESNIDSNFSGSVPSGVTYPNMYITFTATHNYASGFVGGGGGFGGFSVPGSGQVVVHPYAPSSYISNPSSYDKSYGVSFKLKKCYTIPPMVSDVQFDIAEPVQGPVIDVKPYAELQQIQKYWRKPGSRDDRTAELKAIQRR